MRPLGERDQLVLFRTLPGETGLRDNQDLMAYPFFSLAKGCRLAPIMYDRGDVRIQVEGMAYYGIATIWDADVLIWAASHIVAARNRGQPTSRLMAASMHDILRFIGRGTSMRDYERLRAAFDRLQATTVSTTLRAGNLRHMHRFSWLNEWKELAHINGRSAGIELVVPEWFYRGVLDETRLLSLDAGYFHLTGGMERWLYRLVRKHGGRQHNGWRFDLRQLYAKSGCLVRYSEFALQLRRIAARPLLGYDLQIERLRDVEYLRFRRSRGS